MVRAFPYVLLPHLLSSRNRARRRERGDLASALLFGGVALGVCVLLGQGAFWLTGHLEDYAELGDFMLRMGLSWLFLTFLSFLAFSGVVTALSTFSTLASMAWRPGSEPRVHVARARPSASVSTESGSIAPLDCAVARRNRTTLPAAGPPRRVVARTTTDCDSALPTNARWLSPPFIRSHDRIQSTKPL